MGSEKLCFEPEHIIVNLVQADKKTFLPIGRLYKFVYYLWDQLVECEEIKVDRDVIFNVNFNSIERSIQFNNKVFDILGDTIIIKTDKADEYIKTPPEIGIFLSKYAKKFAEEYVA